jgi:pimeloyl-ACP methyl ester carboxylesterase
MPTPIPVSRPDRHASAGPEVPPRAGRWRLTRGVLAALTVLVSVVALTGSPAGASASAPSSTRPTVVLVHGAWADATSWTDVAHRLHADGYRTSAPNLALQSLDADVAQVRAVLDSIHTKKILVAHSYGGMVISAAAAGRSDVVALVFSAAFVPDEGDSIASLGTGFAPSEAFQHLAFTGEPFASPAYIAPNFFRQFFAQDLSPAQAGLLDAAQQPLNFPIVTTPSGPVAWHTLPSWYAVSGMDRMIDPAQELWMATRAGAHIVTYSDASHVGGITRHAAQFTELIEHAAAATHR